MQRGNQTLKIVRPTIQSPNENGETMTHKTPRRN